MKEREFKIQTLRTAGQWSSGLLFRLARADGGGLTILSVPSDPKRLEVVGIKSPVALAADCCGIVSILETSTNRLYQYDPKTGISVRIFCPEALDRPGRMLLAGTMLWVADTANAEVKGCSLIDFQLRIVIDLIEEPIDIALRGQGDLYVLDNKTKLIYRFDKQGTQLAKFGSPYLQDPVGCVMGAHNVIFVIDKGSQSFQRFSDDGAYLGATGDLSALSPKMVAGDARGNLFVLTDAGEVFQFDEDGIFAGKVRFPEDAGPVFWIAFDGCGSLYASAEKGIYVLESGKTFTKEKGAYYSKTLDSGIFECRWHRLVLQGDMPPGTVADIYSYASDDETLKNLVDTALADPAKTTQEKTDVIDSVIPWTGPENNPRDMLFKVKAGRFLWVKLSLATYDEIARPVVREMKIFYPRISYLRYLPAIYQEDALSRDFLERFLSLFESVFYDLEIDISTITRYFDPDTTPPEFLKWLASWVNMAIEEDWQEATKREFIRQAVRLYNMKGTVEGISRFIEIYTGKAPIIIEHAKAGNPSIIGGQFRLGIDSMLVGTPVRGFRLGDDSIIGRVAIRDTVQAMEDPFLSLANRFTVVVDLTQEERDLYEKGLRKIISDEKPAHTAYSLRIAGAMTAGAGNFVGISTIVGGYDPLRLGSSFVGGGLLIAESEASGRVEERSHIGTDTRLI
jgi:phage tail-like protein